MWSGLLPCIRNVAATLPQTFTAKLHLAVISHCVGCRIDRTMGVAMAPMSIGVGPAPMRQITIAAVADRRRGIAICGSGIGVVVPVIWIGITAVCVGRIPVPI